MPNSSKEQWQKDYEHLTHQYHHDQEKVDQLVHQIKWLICKHTDTKYNIALESQKFHETFKKVDNMHRKLKKILSSQDVKVSSKKEAELRKIHLKLPNPNSLLDRIRLMELQNELPTFSENIHHRMTHLHRFHESSLNQMAREHHELKRINVKTHQVINDIQNLWKILKYLRSTQGRKWNIKPSLVDNWLEQRRHFDLKSTINTSNKSERNKLDVRPSYILRNVSRIMPNIYSYLQT